MVVKALNRSQRLTKRYVGQIRRVKQRSGENHFEARYRWITRESDGRYYARAPKLGAQIRDLPKRREKDWWPEKILSSTTTVFPMAASHPRLRGK